MSYYYLFVSYDMCCSGIHSTYKVRVGRSRQITGPYISRSGVPMLLEGSTLVLEEFDIWKGPGHNAIFSEGGQDWLVHHVYDTMDEGRSKLHIRKLHWDESGWPHVNGCG